MSHSTHKKSQPLCHIVTSVGMLGYGINAGQTNAALERFTSTGIPTAMILESGSTDSGPQKLALGGMTVPLGSYIRDLRKLLASACRYNVPLIFSSAGASGTDHSTRELAEVIKSLAAEIGTGGRDLKIVCIFSDIPKDTVKQQLRNGLITGCGKVVLQLTEDDIEACPVIIAQMGLEPFLDALSEHPDLHVLVGGRAYDPAPFVAFAQHCYSKLGLGPADENEHLIGGFTHIGKIMECAGLCAIPKGGGATATVYADGTFDVVPMAPTSKCKTLSVAAHTLYEKSRPDKQYGRRTVHVRDGRFVWSAEDSEAGVYQVKLEGAKAVGYQAMYVGAIKDHILLGQIDEFLGNVRDFVASEHADIEGYWDLQWHVYGNADSSDAPKVCIIGEALAPTQELATNLVATAKVGTIHTPYENQKATSGNLAHGIGGIYTVPLGPCVEFCVYHLKGLEPQEKRGGSRGTLFWTESFTIARQEGSSINTKGSHTQPLGKTKVRKHFQNGNLSNEQVLGKNPVLGNIAQVIRSKNSGRYEITFDVLFAREGVYRAVKEASLLDTNTVAKLYGINPEQVIWSGFFDQARAYKATIPRMRQGQPAAAGGFMEDDVHGSQMYMPLLRLPIPEELVSELKSILKVTE